MLASCQIPHACVCLTFMMLTQKYRNLTFARILPFSTTLLTFQRMQKSVDPLARSPPLLCLLPRGELSIFEIASIISPFLCFNGIFCVYHAPLFNPMIGAACLYAVSLYAQIAHAGSPQNDTKTPLPL